MRKLLFVTLLLPGLKAEGQLGPEHRFLYPFAAGDKVIHDMDGDGDGDLVYGAGELWLYEQTGPNTWAVTTELGAGGGRCFRKVDMNGDGTLDLVFLGSNGVACLPILGGGSYGAIQDIITAMPELRDLQVGDLDGDADVDIVITVGEPYSIAWCANLGGGAFSAPQTLLAEDHPFAPYWNTFAVADLDMDGDLDMATATRATAPDSLICFKNDGSGVFTALLLQPSDGATEILVGDLDDELGPDLIASIANSGLIRCMNEGNGALAAPIPLSTSPDAFIHQLHLVDKDVDGDLDLLFEWGYADISQAPVITCMVNDGTGDLSGAQLCFDFLSDTYKPYAVGDINGSGPLDIVSTIADGLHVALDCNTYSTRLNPVPWPEHITTLGNGRVVLNRSYLFGPTQEGPKPVPLSVLSNAGGNVTQQFVDLWLSPSGGSVAEAVPADLDGDGDLDLLALRQEPLTGTWKQWMFMRNTGGNVDSVRSLAPRFAEMFPDMTLPHVSDLDGDGDLDLVLRSMPGNDVEGGVFTLENSGGGTFTSPAGVWLNTFAQPTAITTIDVDADGAGDYLWVVQDSMIWGPYNGTDGPSSAQYIGMAPIDPRYLEPVDLNADGHEDFVIVSADTVAFLLNDGSNGFLPSSALPFDNLDQSWPYSKRHELGDLDGNGFQDLMAINTAGDIFWYPNFGNGNIGGPFTLITGPEHTGRNDITLADMDGDGDLDVLTCSDQGAAAWLGNDEILPTGFAASGSNTAPLVYPDPMSDEARVVFNQALPSAARIELVDVNGRVVRTLNGNGMREVLIERGALPSGIYLLRIVSGPGAATAARLVVH